MPSLAFSVGDNVVYPSHGVGAIVDIETQQIAGMELKVYVIDFPQEKLTLRVPVSRAQSSGLRALAGQGEVDKIYSTLKGKAKSGNKMWSRRAQEYETKINSGDIVAVSEVVRDLFKNVDTDRSYSERTIYESALNRLAGEVAALENISKEEAVSKLLEVLREKTVIAA